MYVEFSCIYARKYIHILTVMCVCAYCVNNYANFKLSVYMCILLYAIVLNIECVHVQPTRKTCSQNFSALCCRSHRRRVCSLTNYCSPQYGPLLSYIKLSHWVPSHHSVCFHRQLTVSNHICEF